MNAGKNSSNDSEPLSPISCSPSLSIALAFSLTARTIVGATPPVKSPVCICQMKNVRLKRSSNSKWQHT